MSKPSRKPRYRFEGFGAIVASEDPPLLAWVDRDFMRSRGLGPDARWTQADTAKAAGEVPGDQLSAPVEVHLTLTRNCPMSCSHCYTSSGGEKFEDRPLADIEAEIAAMDSEGVFHVAMGGGEPLLHPDLFRVAESVRARGMVPNLTTTGAGLTLEKARRMRGLFGKVNLSVDSLEPSLRRVFDEDKLSHAQRAAPLLREAGVAFGLNLVVTAKTFDHLEGVVRWAVEAGVEDIELLRFKPAGRGKDDYRRHRLDRSRRLRLFPLVLELMKRHRLPLKLDCSSAPFVACHAPSRERMEAFDVVGCIGGISLAGIDAQGRLSACSFYPADDDPATDLEGFWSGAPSLAPFRDYVKEAPEPCASCDYLVVCRGGCRAVALHLTGDPAAADPECPAVEAHAAARGAGSLEV